MKNRVRDIREAKRLSQRQLAELIGVSRVYITQIENDKRRLNSETMEQIADALGVHVSDLFPSPDLPEDVHQIITKVLALPFERRAEVSRFVDYVSKAHDAA